MKKSIRAAAAAMLIPILLTLTGCSLTVDGVMSVIAPTETPVPGSDLVFSDTPEVTPEPRQIAYEKMDGVFSPFFAETDGEPHNTITPIARRRGVDYELDLVLRNNITTPEHPLGVFHPHAALHHIKKENIGLIEVMGLAVLPARLKGELAALEQAILSGADIRADETLGKHADWVEELKTRYTFTPENTADILRREVGAVFAQVLEDAGVFKRNETGRAAFRRFLGTADQEGSL